MKHEHKHFLARLIVSTFLLLGFGFWTSHFVVDAANWTIGSISRNNMDFLSGAFWDNSPTSGDIIKALYGSGDEGSVYTQNWSGYTSGTCLSDGMQVITTGVLPTTLASNTIYVIDSGTYTITTGITMNDCSALISSGIVTLSGNVGGSGTIFVSEKNNVIIEKIRVENNSSNGIYVTSGMNFSLNEIKVSYNSGDGFYLGNASQGMVRNVEARENIGIGVELFATTNTVLTTISTVNNHHGVWTFLSSGNTLSGIVARGNSLGGISLVNTEATSIIGSTTAGSGVSLLLDYTHNIHITNSLSYGTTGTILSVHYSSGISFTQFLGSGTIVEEQHGDFFSTHYDTYTQNNNYIHLQSDISAIVTGTLVPQGILFTGYFDELQLPNFSLSGVNSFTVGGATWDGILYVPTAITTGAKLASTGEVGTTNIAKFLNTIEVVSGSTYLTMNGGTGAIDFYVASGTSGQYLRILKSTDGTSWIANTTQTGCILDENLTCHFTTNGTLKLFAFGVPTNYSFSGITQSGTTVISGGLYNTGVRITFTGENLSGATINGSAYTSGTLISSDGIKTFVLMDIGGNSTGITFTIDTTAPTIIGITPTSGLNYTGGNMMTFTWSGTDVNLSGYTLYINNTGYTMGALTGYTTGLINGAYTWHVVANDRAGNMGTSPIYPFGISTAFSGDISITGTTLIGSQRFTNSAIGIYMRANEPVNYTITGNVSNAPVTGTISAQQGRMIHYPVLTGADGSKDIYVTITNASGVSISKTFLAQLDTVAPAPTLLTPASGAVTVNSPTLSWTTNSVDPAHISGYQYFVSPTPAFGTIVASGTTTATSATINLSSLGLLYTPLYRYVKAIDSLGNSGVSGIQPFYYSGVLDTTPDSFSFNAITHARINRVYASNTLTVTGLSANTPVLVTVSKGALYISGNMVGTTGYVQNGWMVKVELTSSRDYDDYVTSNVTIGDISATFRITTMPEDDETVDDYSDISTSLSSTEKLQIIAIFEALRDLYNGDKKQEFFNSLLVMLESKIDDLGSSTNDKNRREALEYLYDLADQYGDGSTTDNTDIDSTSWIKNGIYTAPNGKKYTIRYDSTKKQFTSTNFLTPKYFPTLDVLKYTIDLANPIGSQYASAKTIKARWGKISIDGTWQTSPYTAPNRKVFYFFKTMEGRYSSYTFTVEKYFDSLDSVKEYIHNNNR